MISQNPYSVICLLHPRSVYSTNNKATWTILKTKKGGSRPKDKMWRTKYFNAWREKPFVFDKWSARRPGVPTYKEITNRDKLRASYNWKHVVVLMYIHINLLPTLASTFKLKFPLRIIPTKIEYNNLVHTLGTNPTPRAYTMRKWEPTSKDMLYDLSDYDRKMQRPHRIT